MAAAGEKNNCKTSVIYCMFVLEHQKNVDTKLHVENCLPVCSGFGGNAFGAVASTLQRGFWLICMS